MAVKRLTPKPTQAQPFRHTILTTLAVAAVLLIAAVPYVRLRLQVWQYAVDPEGRQGTAHTYRDVLALQVSGPNRQGMRKDAAGSRFSVRVQMGTRGCCRCGLTAHAQLRPSIHTGAPVAGRFRVP